MCVRRIVLNFLNNYQHRDCRSHGTNVQILSRFVNRKNNGVRQARDLCNGGSVGTDYPSTPWSSPSSFHSSPLQPVRPGPFRPYPLPVSRRCTCASTANGGVSLPTSPPHNSFPVLSFPPFSSSLFPRDTPRKDGELSQSACSRFREHRNRRQATISRCRLDEERTCAHTWKKDRRKRKERAIPLD